MEDDSEYQLSITPVGVQEPPDCPAILRAVAETLKRFGVGGARINLALVTDDHIAILNETHLSHVGPTDVITFDLRHGPHDGGGDLPIDGELVISVDTALREAADRGHGLGAELALYAVHGTLHLLGHDDHDDEDARRMHALEDEILVAAGFGPVFGGRAT